MCAVPFFIPIHSLFPFFFRRSSYLCLYKVKQSALVISPQIFHADSRIHQGITKVNPFILCAFQLIVLLRIKSFQADRSAVVIRTVQHLDIGNKRF